jgi:hypothetical protein
MNLPTRSRNILPTSILVFASLTISLLAWGQHGESGGQGEHAGNPGRSGGQGRGSAPSHASAPSRENSRGQREAAGTQPGRTATAPNSHSGKGENRGNRGGNTRDNRGGNTPANPADRSGNAAGNRGRNSSGNQGGNMSGNRGGDTSRNPGNRSGDTAGNRDRNPSRNRGGYTAGNRGGESNRRAPGRTVSLRGGGSASFRPNGQVRVIHRDGMRIQHSLRGGRTIVTERRDVRIVTRGGGRGYVQRTYVTRGRQSFYSRTYYNHGVYRVGVYRGYYYNRRHYYGYYPAYWYHPVFYSWAYRPWGPPVYWGVGIGGWGWGPWYGYYGGYFAPYSVYPSAAFWLTDYVIAANLQAAYESRAEANAEAAGYDRGYRDGANQAASNGQVTLTPEVKQAIAEEIRAQLAEEQQQSSGGQGSSYDGQARDGRAQAFEPADGEMPPALDPARRTFVVASDLTVVSNGQECDLTAGDVITRLADTPDADQRVNASVQASKKGDCGAGQQVAVSVEDLQDMRNHFQEQLDSGMKDLAEKQGKGGLPKAPDTGTTASDVPPPAPDTDAAQELTEQEKAADQAESQVEQENAAGPDQEQ